MSATAPTPPSPPVPPPSDWLAQTLLEMNGVLGALDERTKGLGERLEKIDSRLWWLVTFLLTSLAAQVATLVAVLLRR